MMPTSWQASTPTGLTLVSQQHVPAPQAVFHAERGLEWVVFAQQHQHAVVTALANWSCATVTVTFYATFLPSLVCEHLRSHNALLQASIRVDRAQQRSYMCAWAESTNSFPTLSFVDPRLDSGLV